MLVGELTENKTKREWTPLNKRGKKDRAPWKQSEKEVKFPFDERLVVSLGVRSPRSERVGTVASLPLVVRKADVLVSAPVGWSSNADRTNGDRSLGPVGTMDHWTQFSVK